VNEPRRLALTTFVARVRDDASRFRIDVERASVRHGDLIGEQTLDEWMRMFVSWVLEENREYRRPRSSVTTIKRKTQKR
jgi:hypothetical protein